MFQVSYGAHDVLAEECEATEFHRHGFIILEAQAVTLRRCYAGSRDWKDLPGADTVLVSGPSHEPDPPGVRLVKIESARDMLAATDMRFTSEQDTLQLKGYTWVFNSLVVDLSQNVL